MDGRVEVREDAAGQMLQHDRIDVLQMHMGHALAELAEPFDGVPTAH